MPDVPRVVIPLRSFDAGKSRLSQVLTVTARQALIEAMLTDVIDAVRNSGVTDVVIAACGDHAVSLARTLKVAAISDEAAGGGLNAALRRVLATGCGTDQSVMIVAADLPRISADDLACVTASQASVVIAATHDAGTAVLLQRPPAQITLAYGVKSALTHAYNATSAGCDVATVRRDGLLYDLDTPADLAAALRDVDNPLVSAPLGRHTQQVLGGMPRAAMNAATLPPQT